MIRFAKIAFFLFLVYPGERITAQPALSSLPQTCENFISIRGETNINTFHLEQNVPSDLICGVGKTNWVQLPEKEIYLITIPVRNFKAPSKIIYKDFLDLVDVSQHPYIQIFMNESEFENLIQNHSNADPTIGITVAGTTRYYQIPCNITRCLDGKVAVTGKKTLKLTDFKLALPEKTLGLIKVQDKLIINFEFGLPPVSGIKLTTI